MKLEPANIVCPSCESGNYMRHLIGKNVGYLDMKCINCNSYFNFDELYKRRIGEVLKPKPTTNADRIRAMTDEELAKQLAGEQYVGMKTFVLGFDRELLPVIEEETRKAWSEIVKEKLDWLKEEVET